MFSNDTNEIVNFITFEVYLMVYSVKCRHNSNLYKMILLTNEFIAYCKQKYFNVGFLILPLKLLSVNNICENQYCFLRKRSSLDLLPSAYLKLVDALNRGHITRYCYLTSPKLFNTSNTSSLKINSIAVEI